VKRIIKNEKGHALPLALMAVAIGVLVTVPFLGQANASLIGSRTYGQSMTERYSAQR